MVRQYIGARYIPKFVGAWDNTTFYEALSIVEYNNSSYTSKKPVPVGVGNPATATEYWALSGNTSGQIDDLRDRMDTAEDNIDNLEVEDVSIHEEIDELDDKIISKSHTRKFILLGDSFGGGILGDGTRGKGWIKLFKEDNPNYTVYDMLDPSIPTPIVAGNSGFNSSNKFIDCITWLKENPITTNNDINKITDIVVMAGTNDQAYITGLADRIAEFCEYCRTNFPQAKVSIGCIGTTINNIQKVVEPVYKTCRKHGAYYISDSLFLYCDPQYTGEDHTHLTQVGYNFYKDYTDELILFGHTSYRQSWEMANSTGGASIGVTMTNNSIHFYTNNVLRFVTTNYNTLELKYGPNDVKHCGNIEFAKIFKCECLSANNATQTNVGSIYAYLEYNSSSGWYELHFIKGSLLAEVEYKAIEIDPEGYSFSY